MLYRRVWWLHRDPARKRQVLPEGNQPRHVPDRHPSKTWCGRRDLNPHGPFKPCGFSYRLRLLPPKRDALEIPRQSCGLDYPFTSTGKLRSLGAARLVSTLPGWCLSGLGSGLPFEVSPNLSSSASPVSQANTQVFLKSAA
jgi:hypothetical protein